MTRLAPVVSGTKSLESVRRLWLKRFVSRGPRVGSAVVSHEHHTGSDLLVTRSRIAVRTSLRVTRRCDRISGEVHDSGSDAEDRISGEVTRFRIRRRGPDQRRASMPSFEARWLHRTSLGRAASDQRPRHRVTKFRGPDQRPRHTSTSRRSDQRRVPTRSVGSAVGSHDHERLRQPSDEVTRAHTAVRISGRVARSETPCVDRRRGHSTTKRRGSSHEDHRNSIFSRP